MIDKKLVTTDKAIVKGGRLAPADLRMLGEAQSGHALPITVAELMDLVRAASKVRDAALVVVGNLVDKKRAQYVRCLRVDRDYSWRAVAGDCHERFSGKSIEAWRPPSNQLWGMALCEVSAALLGEQYMQEPWN